MKGDDGDPYLGQVERNHAAQATVSLYPMLKEGQGRPRDAKWRIQGNVELVGYGDVLGLVYLEPNGLLSAASLEELTGLGVAV